MTKNTKNRIARLEGQVGALKRAKTKKAQFDMALAVAGSAYGVVLAILKDW